MARRSTTSPSIRRSSRSSTHARGSTTSRTSRPTQEVMSYVDAESGERCPVGSKLPLTKEDWYAKRTAVDTVLDDLGGIVTRVGDETVGEMWSLFDGQDVLNEINPAFSEHIRHHVRHAALADPFHVSANTDPKGDRSKRPQDQDPDVLLHVGGRPTTGSSCAGRSSRPPPPTRTRRSSSRRSATGAMPSCRTTPSASSPTWRAPGVKHICRSSFAGRGSDADYPLSNRFDEVDTMIVFDDVEIPWENVFFYRHTRAAALHPRDAAPLLHVPVRPAAPALRRSARRDRLHERGPDRGQDAPGRA